MTFEQWYSSAERKTGPGCHSCGEEAWNAATELARAKLEEAGAALRTAAAETEHYSEEMEAAAQSIEDADKLRAVIAKLRSALTLLLPYAEDYLRTNPSEDLGYMLDIHIAEARAVLKGTEP